MGLSPLKMHFEKWKNGCGSKICGYKATKRVFCRGSLPCHVLFIGLAPGESENILGEPFVGPAGKLLDRMIENSLGRYRWCQGCDKYSPNDNSGCQHCQSMIFPIPFAMTNLVCCIPRDKDGKKEHEPEREDIESCGPRLIEFGELAKPRLIVCAGEKAKDWTDLTYKFSIKVCPTIPRVDIIHPAAILRANIADQGLMKQRNVINLNEAIEEMMEV